MKAGVERANAAKIADFVKPFVSANRKPCFSFGGGIAHTLAPQQLTISSYCLFID
jgi:hypothetical protein